MLRKDSELIIISVLKRAILNTGSCSVTLPSGLLPGSDYRIEVQSENIVPPNVEGLSEPLNIYAFGLPSRPGVRRARRQSHPDIPALAPITPNRSPLGHGDTPLAVVREGEDQLNASISQDEPEWWRSLRRHHDTLEAEASQVREGFICPILCTVMRSPAFLVETGNTFELSAIFEWVVTQRKRRDPLTSESFSSPMIAPNAQLQREIRRVMNLVEAWRALKERVVVGAGWDAAVKSQWEEAGHFVSKDPRGGCDIFMDEALLAQLMCPGLQSSMKIRADPGGGRTAGEPGSGDGAQEF
ncbi:hypothetical protein CYMTET_14098 [Cymbomonas tetramitiformis]|uniref:U-box domain-containing protein n=1 Tax=Cymbomonas tetramitiformis TaxID=36881 RepID=A0AAE0GH35_9CHLO|nr:hypothetical protein CYMTET_14098 [Cymbomonas tetramitiformis]